MQCLAKSERGLETLQDFGAGKLDSQAHEDVAVHAAACGDCAKLIEEQAVVWAALDDWSAPEVSSDFDAKLYARIEADKARPRWYERLGFGGSWRPVLPFAVSAAVLALALMIRVPDRSVAVPEVADKAVPTEIEQVEQGFADLELLMSIKTVDE